MNPLLSGLYDGILRNMGISKFAESREASLPSAQAEKLAVKPELEAGSPPPASVEFAGQVAQPSARGFSRLESAAAVRLGVGTLSEPCPAIQPTDSESAEILKVLAETEKDCRMFGQGMVKLGTCDWPDGEPDIPCCREKATHLLFDDSTDPVELCERHYKAYLWGKI